MKVLLVVIDGATPRVVCPAVRTGRLPVLGRLADAGAMHEASVSIFPSITPAATTTIVTGAYPDEHGIAGASWYDEARGEVAYYGDDFWVIARKGFGPFVRDFLLRLNGDRLTAPTLFQMVEQRARVAASLNYLVFRGDHGHPVRIPTLLRGLPGLAASGELAGPAVLNVGDFAGTPAVRGRRLRDRSGLLHRFGMDDASTGALLADLFAREIPDLTVAYFADNDFTSHEVGAPAAFPVIERVDRFLGQAFEAAGGLERLLTTTAVLVTSDHGHCEILAEADQAVIRPDELLANFRQAGLTGPWKPSDQIMICPNMRAAQIYVRDAALIDDLAGDLLADDRVDQVIWRTATGRRGRPRYTVTTSRGRLEFWRGRERAESGADAFGNDWSWQGEPDALDLLPDDGAIGFGQYPNAFERIAGVLDLERSGELWVTARPGCEFELPGGKAHVGGSSHGALHALDSLSPVILAGGPVRPSLPQQLRLVDLAPLCMDALGLPMRYRPGAGRAGARHAASPA